MKKFLLSAILCLCAILTFAQAKATTHKIAKGETLYAISKKYHVTVAAIEKANNITGQTKLKLGQSLTIPAGTAAKAEAKPAAKTTAAAKTVTTTTVKTTEKPKTLVADKKIIISTTVKTEKKSVTTPSTANVLVKRAAGDNPSSHVVLKGETLYSLARVYGVSVRHLREANSLADDAALKLGQRINIPSKNPEADYVAMPRATEGPLVAVPKPTETTTQPGREYLSGGNQPVEKAAKAEKVEKIEKKEADPVVVVSKTEPTPVKVSEEKPSTPAATDKPKEIIKEEKAPEPKEIKNVAEPVLNTNISSSDYVTVFNDYGTRGKKKVVYRGIGSFLKSENPGNQYLALYNYADMGAILKVTNLMSKQAIYVKVIGKVPAADAQNEIILKVSGEAANQLKVNEDKFLVEVTGYNAP